MPAKERSTAAGAVAHFSAEPLPFAAPGEARPAKPVWLVADQAGIDQAPGLDARARAWLAAQGFKPSARRAVLVPAAEGGLAGVVLGTGANGRPGMPADPMARTEIAVGLLPPQLPAGSYALASPVASPELAAVAWALGGYRFRRYKSGEAEAAPSLAPPAGADMKRVAAIVDGVGFGRDLINTPSSDMGPEELEAAARRLARHHRAEIDVVAGDDLLAQNFPLLHAVGRASTRAPRLIDLHWEKAATKAARRVTLIGKGICFDTGGLDIKPASGMLLMKKDMGGAAAVLALGHMIMAAGLDVKLRILIAAAENSISGNAFRPGDVIRSRAGLTVEIGNTDAEGRLVLADALALADAEKPDVLLTFATLTGAARVAMGPEVSPFYCDDDAFAGEIAAAGTATADPLWRLPFWTGYENGLDSPVADLNNVSESPFGGSITAALFLRRFVRNAARFAHFDIFGWRPAAKALGPKGAEVQGARAMFHLLSGCCGRAASANGGAA